MTTSTFRLTAQAENDLENIGEYSERTWGMAQADHYLDLIVRHFTLLASEPHLGQPCDELRKGYRKYIAEKHVVFYRTLNDHDGIEIMAILHGSMDFDRHL